MGLWVIGMHDGDKAGLLFTFMLATVADGFYGAANIILLLLRYQTCK